jgi:hypothetical protein
LIQIITDKLNKDFSKGNPKIKKNIGDIVTEYFSREKITVDSLRLLKQKVSKSVDEYRKTSQSCNIFEYPRKRSIIKRKVANLKTVNLLQKQQ